jgi:adenine specific DNA methylase Mod
MSLKDTFKQMKELLSNISSDLEKSENGNKAASQRVRTGTVKLEKLAKLFRKESITFEKKNKGQKKPNKSTPASNSKSKGASQQGAQGNTSGKSKATSTPSKNKVAAPKAKASAVKAKPKAKTVHASTFRPRQFSAKKATAKLPTKRIGHR